MAGNGKMLSRVKCPDDGSTKYYAWAIRYYGKVWPQAPAGEGRMAGRLGRGLSLGGYSG